MKILFIAQRYHTNLIGSVKTLKNNGHTVNHIVQTRGEIESYEELKPVLINSKNILRNIIKVYKTISKLEPDYTILRFPNGTFFYIALFIAKLCNSNLILYQQIDSHNILNIIKQKKISISKIRYIFLFHLFDACLITPLNSFSRKLSKLTSNIYYVPFALRTEKREYIFRNKKRILSIGKFQIRKNHIMTLEAFKSLNKTIDFHFTIIGEISTKEHRLNYIELDSYIKKNGLSDKVSIFANIDFTKIRYFYRTNDIFILSSKDEPAAISPLEAIGYGLINICSKECGTSTYIENLKNGFIINPDDPDYLADLLRKILSNEVFFKEMFYKVQDAQKNISENNYYNFFLNMINDKFNNKKNNEKKNSNIQS